MSVTGNFTGPSGSLATEIAEGTESADLIGICGTQGAGKSKIKIRSKTSNKEAYGGF